MEAKPSIALILLESFSSTPRYSAMASWPCRIFSSEGAPGMYWLAYAVARYKRAFKRSGSRSLASLKSSTAASNCAFLKAATPLFNKSRARSLLHPEIPATRIKATARHTTRLPIREHREEVSPETVSWFIEASIPELRPPNLRVDARIHFCPRGPFHHVQRFFSSSELSRPTGEAPARCMRSRTWATV